MAGSGTNRGRGRSPPQQPDDNGDDQSKQDERRTEDQDQPPHTAQRGNISGHTGIWRATHRTSYGRQVTRDLCAMAYPDVSAYGGCISSDLRVCINQDAAENGGYIARNLSAYVDRTVEAGEVANFLVRLHVDIVAKLCDVRRLLSVNHRHQGKDDRREQNLQEIFHSVWQPLSTGPHFNRR